VYGGVPVPALALVSIPHIKIEQAWTFEIISLDAEKAADISGLFRVHSFYS
jgi:hypothetical protein